jgi:hypothetical protein
MPLRKRPVVTARMIAANRANARLSTGPRTEEGKRRVRFNGLRHGQRAKSFPDAIKAFGGDPADFDRIIREEYSAPETQREARQIERMAYEDWILSGKHEKGILFSTDQSRNVL